MSSPPAPGPRPAPSAAPPGLDAGARTNDARPRTLDDILPALAAALADGRNAVLAAPPGSGKSTLAPPALLDSPWLGASRILLLEPRRVAARAIAARMSRNLGQPLGETVGYRIRQDSRVSPRTRIEVITEGILTRMLQDDAALPGVGLVIFDEFHERSLHADLGLALCLEVQSHLRADLRLLVMSATLDLPRLLELLGAATLIEGGLRPHEVTYCWLGRPPRGARIEPAMTAAIRRALEENAGDVLAFLPGAPEIRRVATALATQVPGNVRIHPLYGDLELAAQEQALMPAAHGTRKVILATDIAQTSLTVEGVCAVVDSGLARVPRFDPVSGMTRLATVNVSRAAATQRAGRAGRTQAGVCYRLWEAAQHDRLAEYDDAEIRVADLAPLALELAVWGERDPTRLRWMDVPNPAAWSQANDLLEALGAIDGDGRVTAHGAAMNRLGAHPRIAHMLLHAAQLEHGRLGCLLAALLQERDPLRRAAASPNIDLEHRVRLLIGDGADPSVDRAQLLRVRGAAQRYEQQLTGSATGRGPGNSATGPARHQLRDGAIDPAATGLLVALAYPERVARRRPGTEPRYQLAGGRGAGCAPEDPLAQEPWLAIAHLDGEAREARIFLAARVAPPTQLPALAARLKRRDVVMWDPASESVIARRESRLGAILIEHQPLPNPDTDALRAALLAGVRAMGLSALRWTPALQQWRDRVQCLRATLGAPWPDVSDEALLEQLTTWLGPSLDGVTRRAQLANVDLGGALQALLPRHLFHELDRLAPTHLRVPSGSNIAVDYSDPAQPALAVKVQEVFGWRQSPRIADSRLPVTLRLLSPARRPVQITTDLASFWANGYAEVRRDLRGRYPRHPWPEDPLTAPPTHRAKPRGT